MPETNERPKLAVIVANSIHGDSRVQKTALAAAHAGWDVLLVGRATGDVIERSWLGPVKVVRVPVGTELVDLEKSEREIDEIRLGKDHDVSEAVKRAAARRRRALDLRDAGTTRAGSRFARRVQGRVERWRSERRPAPADRATPVGDWMRDAPVLLDLDLAFANPIERFRPDVIHCNDITMLPTAAHSVASLRAAGHRVAWLYDAHEYVAGVDWPTPRHTRAYVDVEKEFIGAADAVVTVSPEIAELIAREQNLQTTPLVVRNTPVRSAVGTGGVSVRTAAGLDETTPILVYSGYLQHERGVGTAVAALPDLPDHHLVIVSGRKNAELKKTLRSAQELEVADRVHVVPYVPQHLVPDYLSGADVGIICSAKTINYELSLPTKLAEYLHGGLPVVVSDVKTLSKFVRDTGVGEVFVSGDSESLRDAVVRLEETRAAHVAQISDEILEDLSWESQMKGLLDLYARLAGRGPATELPAEERTWLVTETPRGKRVGTSWRPLGITPVRLGLGPANFAGQLAEFATAVTTAMPEVSAEVFEYRSSSAFGYPADVRIKQNRMRRLDIRLEQQERILRSYTHLVADAFRPVFGGLNGPTIAGDLPALAERDIKVALLSHGTDSRDPIAHMERVEHSLFRQAPEDILEVIIENAARHRAIAAESGLPVFVTTPDLLADLPTARWTPLVVSTDLWASDHPVLERSRPRVLHAPSKRWTKGTDLILPTLEAMDAAGQIELQLVEGVKWSEMREMVRTCDVVIDQFAIGAYGTFACEAMAAGRPVVAWLSDDATQVIGEEPPIVNALPQDLGAALEGLLADREAGRARGAAGVDYVRRVHDGRRTAAAMQDFLNQR